MQASREMKSRASKGRKGTREANPNLASLGTKTFYYE
jgi:hypothetical protein